MQALNKAAAWEFHLHELWCTRVRTGVPVLMRAIKVFRRSGNGWRCVEKIRVG
jgi:hypothetical protein